MMLDMILGLLAVGLLMGSMTAQATYWSLFNIEGESTVSAQYVTYGSLTDMLADTNRLGVFTPNTSGFGRNIVGTDTDGTNYWRVDVKVAPIRNSAAKKAVSPIKPPTTPLAVRFQKIAGVISTES